MARCTPLTVAACAALLLASADGGVHRVAPQPARPSAGAAAGELAVGDPVLWRADGRLYFYRGAAPGGAGRCLISVTATGPTRRVAESALDIPTPD
jgi:hypothetical protein